MASPRYEAKYRKYDDAPGRVIPAKLLSPDPRAADLERTRCGGSLAVGDEHYEPWGTPHGGVIAELAARCMAVQVMASAGPGVEPWLLTSSHRFRRRWTRGRPLRWATTVVARGAVPGQGGCEILSVEASFSMAERVVTQATGTFLCPPGPTTPDDSLVRRVAAHLEALPSPESLRLPVHRAGWEAGRVEGYFEEPPGSLFFALDEALAAAANTVRGDARGDDVAEDFLLADMELTVTGEAAGARVEYESRIGRARSGSDGSASAKLLCDGRVLAHGRGRVAFLQRA